MIEPYQVLWFDPGGKTGWVYASVPGIAFEAGTLRDPEHHSDIRELIEFMYMRSDKLGPLTVGTESFEFRKSPGSAARREGLELISREYIGVMKLVCKDIGLTLRQQSPSVLSGKLVTNDHLAALGLLPPPPLQENKDMIAAARHIVHFLISKNMRGYIIGKYKEAGL